MQDKISSQVNLTNSEIVWLKELINSYFNREKTDPISLMIRLNKQLDRDFDNTKIYYSLIVGGTKPSLFAIRIIDPIHPIIDTSDKVLKLIKESLLNNPNIRRFDVKAIAEDLNYEGSDLDLCLEMIYSLGLFFTSASSSSNSINGFQHLEVDSIDYIKNILEYENMEDIFSQLVIQFKAREVENKLKGRPRSELQQSIANTAFIIMRMDKDYLEGEDVCNTIKDVCSSYDIHAVRADDIEHSDKITDVIIEKIKNSEFIIADLSGEKPNVYYEVGYAHAINKRPILYRKNGSKIHFDLASYNVPEYSNLAELRRLLTNRFSEILGKKVQLS